MGETNPSSPFIFPHPPCYLPSPPIMPTTGLMRAARWRRRGGDVAEQWHQERRQHEGQHDGAKGVGEGEGGGFAVGQVPELVECRLLAVDDAAGEARIARARFVQQ